MEVDVDGYYELSSRIWQFLVRIDAALLYDPDNELWLSELEKKIRMEMNRIRALGVKNGS